LKTDGTQISLKRFVQRQQEAVLPVLAHCAIDATTVLFGLKFANDIHDKFNSSQASKAMLQSSKHTGAKQNVMQNGESKSFMTKSCVWSQCKETK